TRPSAPRRNTPRSAARSARRCSARWPGPGDMRSSEPSAAQWHAAEDPEVLVVQRHLDAVAGDPRQRLARCGHREGIELPRPDILDQAVGAGGGDDGVAGLDEARLPTAPRLSLALENEGQLLRVAVPF